MIPPLIVERALDAGLDLIAITDHNASANAGGVIEAANISVAAARTRFRLPPDAALIRASDAHWLDAIGSAVTEFEIEGSRSMAGLVRALKERRFVTRET